MNWLALGRPENWISAFDSTGIWGLRESQSGLWGELKVGDTIFFYVTSPVSGIIGEGTVSAKFKQRTPLWPEEKVRNEVIWPLRFQFDVVTLITQHDWASGSVSIRDLNIPLRSGFQPLDSSISSEIEKRLGSHQTNYLITGRGEKLPSVRNQLFGHNEIRDIIVEMGKMQGYWAEREYSMDNYRLDAIWKRIYSGSPTYVFEVQVGGSIEAAISKLKHAYDKWNSNIFIVTGDKNDRKLETLLSGTFHEIRESVKVVGLKEVNELYELKRNFKEKERNLGLY